MFGIESAVFLRLLVAALLGAAVGLERSIAGKQAGMRTYALVSLGSCLFVLVGVLSALQFSAFQGLNPQQIAASVVIGIGFIGAGLAAIRLENAHAELTTASGIWLVAGIGMACGFGLFNVALVAAVLGVLVLSLLLKFENMIRGRFGIEREQ